MYEQNGYYEGQRATFKDLLAAIVLVVLIVGAFYFIEPPSAPVKYSSPIIIVQQR